MRCPKCQYISFEDSERCRNCGYEFALVVDEDPPLEVTIGREEPPSGRSRDRGLSAFDTPISHDPPATDQDRAGNASPGGELRRPLTAADLPLFTERVADDQAPLVTPPAVPRVPLSVRRTNPRIRARAAEPEELSLDLAAEPEEPESSVSAPPHEGLVAGDIAGVGRRALAGAIDVVVMGTIQASVVYLTLRACELPLAEWRQLPLVPLVAFLLLLCGGYFVLFTAAGGQTIGKMISGIRVVCAPGGSPGGLRVPFNTAAVRTVASLGSMLALGTGFIPVLLSPDRRAFHDRVAETRVVIA